MISGDTIAAISSATGAAPRMIVRLSGAGAQEIAGHVWVDDIPAHASARRGTIVLGDLRVPAWCYVFNAPRSYTAENTVEFHLSGNPLLASMLLEDLLRHGARLADPGEFTARAYFNGRMDLTEAEGVAATIAAGSEQELSAARRLMSGELSRRIAPAIDSLANTLALVEVGIDFSDEDVTFLPAAQVSMRIAEIDRLLQQLLDESSRFERLAHEPTVILVGRPNAGKSTLLNALAGQERAVVSPTAGTTRDVLSADVALARGIIRLTDAAGLEEQPGGISATLDSGEHRRIDRKMREQALRALQEADHVVLVRDARDSRPELSLPRAPGLRVLSKCDLLKTALSAQSAANEPSSSSASGQTPAPFIEISALGGRGLHELRAALDRLCFGESSATATLSLNARHIQAIEEARLSLSRAGEQVNGGAEFIALELRQALDALGRITGQISPDDLLGRVFSAFCIGK